MSYFPERQGTFLLLESFNKQRNGYPGNERILPCVNHQLVIGRQAPQLLLWQQELASCWSVDVPRLTPG
jgi:hypothetical protein